MPLIFFVCVLTFLHSITIKITHTSRKSKDNRDQEAQVLSVPLSQVLGLHAIRKMSVLDAVVSSLSSTKMLILDLKYFS